MGNHRFVLGINKATSAPFRMSGSTASPPASPEGSLTRSLDLDAGTRASTPTIQLIECNRPSPLTAGRGRLIDGVAPWPAARNDRCAIRLRGGAVRRSALFDNPVVGHTRNTHPRVVEVDRVFRSASVTHNRVSGNLHYSTVRQYGFARRESRGAVSKNPYGSTREARSRPPRRETLGRIVQSFE